MYKEQMIVNGIVVMLTVHLIEDEIAEVYATWDDTEIAFAYDLEEMQEKLEQYFKAA